MMFRPGYQIRDQQAHYFLTFQVVNWIDIFTRSRYRDIFLNSIRFCQRRKGLTVYAWVIMSNHVHCILSVSDGGLSGVIRDLKHYTSNRIIQSVIHEPESRRAWMLAQFQFMANCHKRNYHYQLWTHDNHPVELRGRMFEQRLNYIHNNPVKAGIVEEPEHYLYSSARDYAGMKGLLDIDFIF